MKGDFSRSTFDPAQHFTSVRMQQGRMQLDADWNEQMDILLYLLRAQALDLMGPYGAPAGSAGFAIAWQETDEGQADLAISAGRYYVDGILVQNEKDTLFSAQPYGRNALLPENAQVGDRFVAYLDVWERHLSGAEAPSLLEPALNGLDTTTRVQTVWQVKLWRGPAQDAGGPPATDEAMIDAWQAWRGQETRLAGSAGHASLQPRVTAAGYGLTNQLYRVEIHNAGDEATFKWSRDNGSVVVVVATLTLCEDKTRLTATLEDLHSEMPLQVDDWLELSDATFEFSSQPGLLFQVKEIPGRSSLSAELCLAPGAPLDDQSAQNIQAIAARLQNPPSATGRTRTILRRWDYHAHTPGVIIGVDGALQVQEGQWLPLENGIEVRFENTSLLRAGDYWLLPARSEAEGYTLLWDAVPANKATGQRTFAALPVRRVDQHYAPLALLAHNGTKWTATDLRKLFQPLASFEADETAIERRLQKSIDALRSELVNEAAATLAAMHGLRDEMLDEIARMPSVVYPVADPRVDLESGQVVAIDPVSGGIELARRSNASLVVGVALGPFDDWEDLDDVTPSYQVAQTGRHQCRVTGRVEPGDLLVPSDTPGCAMAAGIYIQPGTVIGKALQGHHPTDPKQCSPIAILVTLR